MLKKLLACAAIALSSGSMFAQTDVTSTYLTNPSFELKAEGTVATAEGLSNNGTYYGWQLPNLGASYVNISIGNSTECAGNAFGVPTAKEGSTYYYCRRGWNSSSTADATLSTTANLPAGSYTLTISYKGLDSWDSSHNSKGSNLTLSAVEGGSTLASSKTANFDAVNGNAAGKDKFTGEANWKEASVVFDVEEAGEVTLNIIHHLVGGVRSDVVIDDVKLLSIPAIDKVKADAKASLPAPAPEFFGLTAEQLEEYNSKIDAATTEAEIEGILDEVNSYEAPAFSGSWNIKNVSAGIYMGNAVLTSTPIATTFEKAANGVYIKVGESYINMAGNNTWSMSANAEAKTAWTFTLADGKYTIAGPNGLIGSDATADGSALYGNKGTNNNGYWTIDVAISEEEIELAKAKNELESAINKIIVPTANIEGNTENVVAWGKTSVDDVKVALESANFVLATSNDIDVIKACTDEVNNLGCEIVLPVCNEINPYNIIMAKEGLGWSGNAVTFTYSEGNQNNYAMAYSEKPGESNFNQAVYFDLNADKDLYMYIIDAEGKKWYVTDGAHVGSTVAWAGSQIRMTGVEEDAMPIDIEPSLSKEGVCELFNIWTGEHIGSTGNNGFYCSNDNYELAIKPAAKKEIDIKVAKYGTVILPADDSNGLLSVKFYSVNSLEENELVLTEENGTLKANTPYIVENLSTIEDAFVQLEKYANAFKPSYTNGLLTGVFADTTAPTGSYVLQNQNDKVAFYAVSAEDPITVPAGKAYLTVPANTETKSINFPSATAINAIEALTSGSAKIYDVNGREINKLQKGINIVNGVKVMVK